MSKRRPCRGGLKGRFCRWCYWPGSSSAAPRLGSLWARAPSSGATGAAQAPTASARPWLLEGAVGARASLERRGRERGRARPRGCRLGRGGRDGVGAARGGRGGEWGALRGTPPAPAAREGRTPARTTRTARGGRRQSRRGALEAGTAPRPRGPPRRRLAPSVASPGCRGWAS